MSAPAGPLSGVRIVELAAIGPAPFCGMMLADAGATVTKVERPGGHPEAWGRIAVFDRGKQMTALDLKSPDGVSAVLDLVADADALIEGFRPGVTERLGLGPAVCLARNPRLVYGRLTGWGQHGPRANTAGHDITYLATSGALHAFGTERGAPVAPANVLGDFGGGGMFLAFGVVSAILASRSTGSGQVIDAAIVDGVATLSAMLHDMLAAGDWVDQRGVNLLDGGAPFYATYRCADGGYVAVGALEERFYRLLLDGLGLANDPACAVDHLDRDRWPAIRARLQERFATRTRDEWAATFASTDACVAPVLSLAEAAHDPHNVARRVFTQTAGAIRPAAAPRFAENP